MKTPSVSLYGEVVKILPNALYTVILEKTDTSALCYLCGKMTKRFIKPAVGDRVRLEFSATDIERGRIVQRL